MHIFAGRALLWSVEHLAFSWRLHNTEMANSQVSLPADCEGGHKASLSKVMLEEERGIETLTWGPPHLLTSYCCANLEYLQLKE